MSKEPRGRLYQDPETKEPILIYLKVEDENWHQYFLDAGMGFWEDWGTENLDNEEEGYDYIDLTEKYKLRGEIISTIICEEDFKNSKITIVLKDKSKLILRCIKPDCCDSDCEFVKEF